MTLNDSIPVTTTEVPTTTTVAPTTAPTTATPTAPKTAVSSPQSHPASAAAPRAISRDTVAQSTALNDSVAAQDSVAAKPKSYGVVLEVPAEPEVAQKESDNFGMSWILLGFFLLFAIIGIRFRNNNKFTGVLFRNLVEVRVRSNVFDETVRETSFIVLLNLLWSCSAGLLLYGLIGYMLVLNPTYSFGIPALTTHPVASMAVCMGVMVVYTAIMALAYFTVGTVFSDVAHARMWLKGFLASQALMSVVFFPLALMLLYYPQWAEYLLYVALGAFLLCKIAFIWKGFRIFFTQISSWVLFLYYLCSLEIVPLILTYWAACLLCSLL